MNTARVVIAIVVILGVASAAVAQQAALDEIMRREHAAQIQNYRATIEQTQQLLQSGATDYRVRAALASAADIADQLTSQLAQVAAVSDASTLERGYQQWEATGQQALVQSAIVFARFLAEKRVVFDERLMQPWQRFAQTVVGIVQANGNPPFDRVDDLPRLKAELWRLRFVRSARGVQDRIGQMEVAIQSLEARLAQQQEADRIKATLQTNIATGKTDAALEQRITALPEDLRVSVEAARREAEESKARRVAQAEEEQRRQEAALKYQREIDEAIRLRKEEIETGKANPVAERQRRADPGLAQSVKVWEEAYRQEQAEKKAAEAKRKLAEIERVKAEEQRRRQAESAARRADVEQAEKEATEAKRKLAEKRRSTSNHSAPQPDVQKKLEELRKQLDFSNPEKRMLIATLLLAMNEPSSGQRFQAKDGPKIDACVKLFAPAMWADLRAHGIPAGATHVDSKILDGASDRGAIASNECLIKAGLPPIYACSDGTACVSNEEKQQGGAGGKESG